VCGYISHPTSLLSSSLLLFFLCFGPYRKARDINAMSRKCELEDVHDFYRLCSCVFSKGCCRSGRCSLKPRIAMSKMVHVAAMGMMGLGV
jgi:hypothetical protein